MKTIKATEILDYYDGVEIFAGIDEVGGSYLGVRHDISGDHDSYVVVGVRPERLREFRSGVLDLRDLMLDAPGGEWFTCTRQVGTARPALRGLRIDVELLRPRLARSARPVRPSAQDLETC